MADDDLFFPDAAARRSPGDGSRDDDEDWDDDGWDGGPPIALRWAVGLVAAAVLAVGGFVVGRMTAPDGGGRSVATGAATSTTSGGDGSTTTAAATATTSSTAPPPTLTADDRIQLDRIGPVGVGMTLAEASAAAGQPIEVDERSSPGGSASGCVFAVPSSGVPAVSFMVIDGVIARIDVGTPGVVTLSGVGVGSTVQEVLTAYGEERIAVEPHPYDEGGQYLRFLTDRQSDRLLIFETDGEVVTSYRAGDADAVSAPEGCA